MNIVPHRRGDCIATVKPSFVGTQRRRTRATAEDDEQRGKGKWLTHDMCFVLLSAQLELCWKNRICVPRRERGGRERERGSEALREVMGAVRGLMVTRLPREKKGRNFYGATERKKTKEP